MRGFTLAELMIVMMMASIAIGALGGTAQMLYQTDRHTDAYVRDVSGLRKAVRMLESDLRAGTGAVYRLDGDRLLRDDRLVARNIGTFELDREGALTVVRIGPAPRREVPAAWRPVVTLRVVRR